MLAIVCPGQGAQSPGMLSPWLELASARDSLELSTDAAGLDLIALGTAADADTIRDTSIAQPLLVATALAAYASLDGVVPGVVAGHSVGEFSAAAVAGVLSPTDAVRLVRARGVAMAAAAAASEPTSMAAILGGDDAEIAQTLLSLDLTPANMNGGGQVVAAGTASAIAELVANPPARARVIELQVAGAFHTRFMAPAVPALAEAASTVIRHNPSIAILTNADGSEVATGDDVVAGLIAQIARPVRWDLCMDTLIALGVTGIIELAPGGVLSGLAKRSMKGVPSVALKTPDDLEAALELSRSVA
ncbi:ACP S-malonyltransferase [Demequina lutea]|uniref:Malonyl CoA-acyl carrier protein transacylase n=1 Tax=Demequina lutea TaxID=431489 RepID=A0A7Z0CJV6_9MICO|nr:ACP S-malonyltransferase [Demequina lutea]NYI41115.1 [acyl-carrier-protein] S-malonyltransferase [Demequina lutea]